MKTTGFIHFAQFVALLTLLACDNKESAAPAPSITDVSSSSGLIGAPVTILGNNFVPAVPAEKGAGPHVNTSVIAFNGVVADAPNLYQDSIGKQRINTTVPAGATTGKITVTANGHTATWPQEFSIITPIYLPNVTVSTVPGWGLDIEADNAGNLFVTRNNPPGVLKLSADGSTQTLWSTSEIVSPWGIAVDASGNIYASVVNAYVVKIAPNGQSTILAGSSTQSGFADGAGADARFGIPLGIDVDNSGNIYVADLTNYKIRKITPDGTVTTFAGSTKGHQDGPALQAKFESPYNLTVGNDGNIYVADGGRVRKITTSGAVSTVAGTELKGFRDGPISTAQFGNINGLVKDVNGNIYLSDEGNFVVRRIGADGNITTVAGSLFGYLDGPGSTALFSQTQGMTIDASGHIYVTQGGGLFKIRKITIN